MCDKPGRDTGDGRSNQYSSRALRGRLGSTYPMKSYSSDRLLVDAACSEVDGTRSWLPAYHHPSASLAGGGINALHRSPKLLRGDPVRRILETRDVKDEGEIPTLMIAPHRRKVTAPGLAHCGAVVGCNNDGLATGGGNERGSPRLKA